MNRCLRDQTLLLVHQGESGAADRAHVKTCLRCAARYQRLVQDLQVIGSVLREAPPSGAALRRPRAFQRPAVAVAAALAALVMFAGLEAWMWHESVSWVSPRPNGDDAETLAFLEEVSRTLSSAGDASSVAVVMLTPVPEFTDMIGAPQTQWPDEWDESTLGGR